uniref:Uncharacterized protein n=1 Tax=Arundo donax TaxID=35708 RepID=A0A0A8YQ12_ARUDO
MKMASSTVQSIGQPSEADNEVRYARGASKKHVKLQLQVLRIVLAHS